MMMVVMYDHFQGASVLHTVFTSFEGSMTPSTCTVSLVPVFLACLPLFLAIFNRQINCSNDYLVVYKQQEGDLIEHFTNYAGFIICKCESITISCNS